MKTLLYAVGRIRRELLLLIFAILLSYHPRWAAWWLYNTDMAFLMLAITEREGRYQDALKIRRFIHRYEMGYRDQFLNGDGATNENR